MIIHYLQHVAFEGLGSIADWAGNSGYQITSTKLYNESIFPSLASFDWLIIMGGPMSVHDTNIYPWLTEEKKFIKNSIESGKLVLGICLGAQLIADVLGARVYPGKEKEIGWFPIVKTRDSTELGIGGVLPGKIDVFHWHEETFELPDRAKRLATSTVCENQAFVFEKKVIGLQFHLESTRGSVKELIKNCSDEIVAAPYIQTAEAMVSDEKRFEKINTVMDNLLNYQSKLVAFRVDEH